MPSPPLLLSQPPCLSVVWWTGCPSTRSGPSLRSLRVLQIWGMKKIGKFGYFQIHRKFAKSFVKQMMRNLNSLRTFFFESLTIFLRRVEFSTPAYNLLNALEKIGYRYLFMFYNRSSSRAKFAEFEYQEIILTSSVLSG